MSFEEEQMDYEMDEQQQAEWYNNHQKKMLAEGKYHDPCKGCGGEDCACCSYGQGY